MSKLEELIEQLCPNGVECVELSNILTIRNGKDYKNFPEGKYPVYGTGGIMTYIDRFAYDKPSVLIPRKGSLDKLYYVEEPFWTVDTIFYTEIDTLVVLPKFVFYYLQMLHLETLNKAGGVPSLTQTVLNKILIPLPPLPIQEEIVRIHSLRPALSLGGQASAWEGSPGRSLCLTKSSACGRLWQFAHPRPLSLLQRGLAPRSKGKARAELRPARRQARLPHSRSLLLPGRER